MKSLSNISETVADFFPSVVRVGISTSRTSPAVGTHQRDIDFIHAGTHAEILRGFRAAFSDIRTVNELKSMFCQFVAVPGQEYSAQQVVVLGQGNKVLHGGRVLN